MFSQLIVLMSTLFWSEGSVVDFGLMVATSGPCFTAKLWKNYGCFCGIGSCGSQIPVDCLDSCCAKHDWCYHDAGISSMEVFWLKYNWKRTRSNRISCRDCSRRGRKSKRCRKCLCDRQMTYCLRGKPCPDIFGRNRANTCPSQP